MIGGPDLKQRTLSALIMIPIVLGITIYGGIPFALLWLVAAVASVLEWAHVTVLPRRKLYAGIGITGIAVALGCIEFSSGAVVAPLLLVTAAAGGLIAGNIRSGSSGVLVAAATCVPIVVLRDTGAIGLWAVLYVYAVVWSTDIGAYFVGRAFGGPKLAPRLSPNKTWSGAIGGALLGTAAGCGLLMAGGFQFQPMILVIGLGLSMVGQMGDLAESAFKRAFGVKDAGSIIPGHGGVLDRIDGFTAAALLALLIGMARSLEAPAAGLLLW